MLRILPVSLIFFLCAAAGEAQPRHVTLTLKRAVEIATSPEGSTRTQLASELTRQAEARLGQARAALLPNVDGFVSYQSLTRNLEALGIGTRFTDLLGPNFSTFVGPFNVFDVRATGRQSILDLGSIRRFQAARAGVRAASVDEEAAAEQTAGHVARAYVAALRAAADVDAVRANIDLAVALLREAENQRAAGTGTGIEVTRARVQLSNERQRLLVSENEHRRARLQLLRAMNLPLDTTVDLADRLVYAPLDQQTLETAAKGALDARPDYRAQQLRLDNARLTSSAAKFDRFPKLSAFGDYGTIGTAITNAVPTRSIGVILDVPVFNGGRREAQRAEAESLRRQEQIRASDLKEQIRLEVQLAIDSLRSADEEVKVAREGLGLAENELAQARRRFAAGVATGLEVTDAQTRLTRARDNQTAALYHHAAARIDLGQATGTLRRSIQ